MARYSFSQIDQWAAKVERRAEAVLKQSVNDMLADIEIVPGMARGGTPQKGTIPRYIGALANSLQSSLNGSTAISGKDSHHLIIGRLRSGDTVRFVWGGNIAPHARRIHYGWGTYPGTFWRDVAMGKWRSYVKASTIRAKALIP